MTRRQHRLIGGVGVAIAALCVVGIVEARAQGQRGAAPAGPPPTPRAVAPADFTGTWVAVVTEDWRWRMMTAPIGDVSSIPVNAEGRRITEAWDPAKDVAAGEQCRAYGAAGIMRLPTRLRISWQDDNTLKMELDNGTQTRLFHFDAQAQPPAQPDWQGFSRARWETNAEGQGQAGAAGGVAGGQINPTANLSGSLRVITTRMRPGYLRRNGVPYSGNATMTEFFDRTGEPNGDSWFVVTTVVDDPTYLAQQLMLTTHFKRESDGSKFQPRPCEVTLPVVAPPAQ